MNVRILLLFLSLLPAAQAAADLNVRANPVYFLGGAINTELDIGVGNRWALGPSVTTGVMLDEFIFGAHIHRYRQPRRDSGWYTGLAVRHSPTGLAFTDRFTSIRILERYQWHGDNFNLAVGIGPDLRQDQREDWQLWVGADLSLGWRF